LDRQHVKALAESIADAGLINPIMVRHVKRHHGGILRDVYEIVAGNHRYEAVTSLGRDEIECRIVEDMDELKVELAEIDENLIRSNLSKAQEAIAVHRRKEIYEAMHPETKRGAFNQHTAASRNSCEEQPDRFTAATAKATGKSERTVQLSAEAGKKLGADLHDIVGTSLDNVRDLQALTQMDPAERAPIIERAKAGERVRARKEPRIAADPLHDVEANEAQVARLMSAWNAAGPDARQEFLSRIDAPIMDRRFA
jgi:sRNA-binding carbon storage regulator CsrA